MKRAFSGAGQGPRRGAARAYREASLPPLSLRGAKVGFLPRIRALTDRHTPTSPGEACAGGVHKHKGSRHSRIRMRERAAGERGYRGYTLGYTEACSSRWAPRESNHCLALASVYGGTAPATHAGSRVVVFQTVVAGTNTGIREPTLYAGLSKTKLRCTLTSLSAFHGFEFEFPNQHK